MIFISHDLSVVREIADGIMVLYLGRAVELADCDTLFQNPRHPYTRTLISAVPVPDPKIERNRKRVRLAGELPSVLDPGARLTFLQRASGRERPAIHRGLRKSHLNIS